MTPLEALEKIKLFVSCNHPQEQMYLCETEEYNTIEKSLKALEIIKEKEVQVCNLKHYIKTKKQFALEHYNWVYEEYNCMQLTKEEYDLLKEVLE